ncbi:MAG: glycosyltransferase [Prevotella sp.]|nr:glycosyltransferase [Prevotella sp.]
MTRTSIYVSNASLTPSSYYRLTQYFANSRAEIHSALPDNVYTWWHSSGRFGKLLFMPVLYLIYVCRTLLFLLHDWLTLCNGTVIISRVIVPHHMPLLHRLLIKRLARNNQIIWDFDDNIIENKSCPRRDFRFFARHSDHIVVTNNFLLTLLAPEHRKKASLLPTTDGDMKTLDTAAVMAQRQALYVQETRLVWVATASGLPYITSVIPFLDEAARVLQQKHHKKLSLHIVCSKPLTAATTHLNIVNIRWTRERAKQEMALAHIGIMPLPDTEFTRGKGGFKLIQYTSAAMPVIASDVGYNRQVVTHETGFLIPDRATATAWTEAILELAADWSHYKEYAQNAKKRYDEAFSYDRNKAFWEQLTHRSPKLMMIVNEDRFFLSHRQDIALAALHDGWDVTIVCKDTGRKQEVKELGLKIIDLPINPTGTNLTEELRTFMFLWKLYRKNKDAIVHHVGLKNILWGGLAARLAHVKGVVNAVSGLGVMFSDENLSATTKGILLLLRFSHQRDNVKVIFQNHEDEDLFMQHHIINRHMSVFIKGSGINLEDYKYTPEQDSGAITVLFTARMVKEKGVIELIEAAEQLRKDYEGKVQFWLCGGLSNNPKALKKQELEQLCDGKYIKWMGYRDDVKQLLIQSHIMAFPSYYREGVPKSLIEACAIGRPIVTTNSIGCKDTVDDGKSGYLIPVRDSQALAEKLKTLIDNPQLRRDMGRHGREKAEKEFSIKQVIDKHMETYRALS